MSHVCGCVVQLVTGTMRASAAAFGEMAHTKTARLFLRLFGISSVPEWIAILLGLVLWFVVGTIIVALLR